MYPPVVWWTLVCCLQISKVAMLAPKDVRVITASLSSSSLLELQEVPRSADRAPSRTFYLWHVDLPRAYTALISHLYKTLANLGQRKAAEVEKKRALVERRERVDVRESGGELLGEVDRKEGKELDERLMKLTLAEMRTGTFFLPFPPVHPTPPLLVFFFARIPPLLFKETRD